MLEAIGKAGFVDAVAVLSAFNAYSRVADSTGMPVRDEILEDTAKFREELGLNSFLSAGGQ